MRLFFTFGSLLVVLVVIAVTVRTQLHAGRRLAGAASAPASGAVDAVVVPQGSPQQITAQYQRELDKAMKAGAQHTADQAASAADDVR